MSEIQQTVVKENIRKGESLNKGKRPVSFQTYEKMCELLYVGGDNEYLFVYKFLTMEWNIITRIDNCVNMHLNHVQ